jgi:sensor c-di-GMP phosphodiesterase-like protein
MRKTSLIALSTAIGGVLLVLPVALALLLSWHEGRAHARHYLEQLSADVLRRSGETRIQVTMAIESMRSSPQLPPCSEEQLLYMREVIGGYDYLKGLGVIRGHALLCSSLSELHQPLQLGRPHRVNPSGIVSWSSVELPGLPGTYFNINARDGFVAIIPQKLVLDTFLDDAIHLAHVGANGAIIRSRGVFREQWLVGYKNVQRTFFDADYFINIIPSETRETLVVAAMDNAHLWAYVRSAMVHRVPVGLLVGFLLATLVPLAVRYHLSLRAQLRRALKRREFFLLYQPVIDLNSGSCVGAEALIRWRRPHGDPISPAVFIAVAEKAGLIVQITAQVMEMIAEDSPRLFKAYPDAHVAINFSPNDLHSAQTEARLQALVHRAGAEAGNILVEVTERGLMLPEKAKAVLVGLREKGFKVAIDDFGTGNSSLSYLATYDLDYLKIDKMFVDELGGSAPRSRLAFHIIEMARTLSLEMIAEGVETAEQHQILREAGVQFAQGWLFAKPMGMSELIAFMHQRNTAQPAFVQADKASP